MCRIVILNILNLNDLKNIMIMISTTYKDESTIYKDKSTTYKDTKMKSQHIRTKEPYIIITRDIKILISLAVY